MNSLSCHGDVALLADGGDGGGGDLSSMAHCTLLSLPYEIRLKIYDFMFSSTPAALRMSEVNNMFWWWKEREYAWKYMTTPPYSLLDTCQQIHDEALPVLRARLFVLCEISREAANSKNATIPIRYGLRDSIQYLHLVVHTEFTFWPQNDMSQLRKVLIEGTYKPSLILQASGSPAVPDGSVPDVTPAAIIDAVKLWHLDLLNEPEIPDRPGSWGMLQAINHPNRSFALEWKGGIVVHYPTLFTSVEVYDLHFDWDAQQFMTGEEDVLKLPKRLFG